MFGDQRRFQRIRPRCAGRPESARRSSSSVANVGKAWETRLPPDAQWVAAAARPAGARPAPACICQPVVVTTPTVAVLSYGDHRVSAHFGDASLAAGIGAHQLSLPCKFSASWLDPEDPTACTPVYVEARLHGDNTTAMRWLGDSAPTVLVVRGYPVLEQLRFALSNDQVLALDAARKDEALLLRLDLAATLLAPPAGVHFHRDQQVPLRVEAHAWLEQLDRLGSELSILLRVPGAAADPGTDGRAGRGLLGRSSRGIRPPSPSTPPRCAV